MNAWSSLSQLFWCVIIFKDHRKCGDYCASHRINYPTFGSPCKDTSSRIRQRRWCQFRHTSLPQIFCGCSKVQREEEHGTRELYNQTALFCFENAISTILSETSLCVDLLEVSIVPKRQQWIVAVYGTSAGPRSANLSAYALGQDQQQSHSGRSVGCWRLERSTGGSVRQRSRREGILPIFVKSSLSIYQFNHGLRTFIGAPC